MLQTMKTFGQKILYGFGFGIGMTSVYANANIFQLNTTQYKHNFSPRNSEKIY